MWYVLRYLGVLLTFVFAYCADAPGATEAQRILVTVRTDAVDAMYGDAVERYRRPHDYRAGPTVDRVLDAIAGDYAIVRVDGWPMRALALHCEVYAIAKNADAGTIVARLSHDRRVESAQILQHFHTLTAATSYRPLQYALDELDIDRAHGMSRGRGVRVAVIDSGIDAQHPDLRDAVRLQRDFVDGPPAAHGTEVAGVIAARRELVGVAPEAELLDLRACWSDGTRDSASCDSFGLARALDYAIANSVDVINLSLAGPDDALLTRLLAAADAHAICVIAAAPPLRDAAHAFPGSVRSVLLVSVSGDTADGAQLSAPGVDVLTTFPGSRYDYASGSSVAAAHVSGVIALVRAIRPQTTPQQMRALLTAHARLSAATVLRDAPTLR
ncbi:MAG TPA: S8 family serine peptidase [Rudaea sp.]|nr:S8 family serine peptidase [Rudaea sp.]